MSWDFALAPVSFTSSASWDCPARRSSFHRDTVIANGQPLVERYQVKPLLWRLDPIQLGPNEYFVMGDNRSGSMLGPVPKNWIIGKAIF
jgi:hypothetical protein